MARQKFSFEKRPKEKARQQKQLEKAARKKEAKLRKAGMDPEDQVEGTDHAGGEADAQPVAEAEETQQ